MIDSVFLQPRALTTVQLSGNLVANVETSIGTFARGSLALTGWQACFHGAKTGLAANTRAQCFGAVMLRGVTSNTPFYLAHFDLSTVASPAGEAAYNWTWGQGMTYPLDLAAFFPTDVNVKLVFFVSNDPTADVGGSLTLYLA